MKNYLFENTLSGSKISSSNKNYLDSLIQHIQTQLIDIEEMGCHFFRVAKNDLSPSEVSCGAIDIYSKSNKVYAINLIICESFEWPQKYQLENGQAGVDIYLNDAVDTLNLLFYLAQKFLLQYHPTQTPEFGSDFQFIRVKSDS